MQPPLLLVEREMLSIRYSYGMLKLRTGKKGQLTYIARLYKILMAVDIGLRQE